MIKPLENYVVLEEEAIKLDTQIVLTDNPNIDRPIIAKVVVAGPDVKKVKIEDRVMFKYHLFDEVVIEKKKYLVGKEEGIFALC